MVKVIILPSDVKEPIALIIPDTNGITSSTGNLLEFHQVISGR